MHILMIRKDAESVLPFYSEIMLQIIPAIPAQLDLLLTLERQTFTETFKHLYSPADFATYMQEKKTAPRLAAEMAQPDSYYYIIFADETPAGFIKLNFGHQPDNAPLQETPVMEVEKIYVLQQFQGMRAGHHLLDFAQQQAEQAGVRTIWLGVWEHNIKTQRFYSRNGFEKFGSHPFQMGAQTDTDWLLRKHL